MFVEDTQFFDNTKVYDSTNQLKNLLNLFCLKDSIVLGI